MQNFKPRGNMHDKRTRYLFYPANEGQMVKLDIHHRDGGVNFASYKQEARGIEIGITVINVGKAEGGVVFEQYSPMSDCNGRFLIVEQGRYSAKKLAKVVEAFDDAAPEICKLWMEDRQMAFDMVRTTAAVAAEAVA